MSTRLLAPLLAALFGGLTLPAALLAQGYRSDAMYGEVLVAVPQALQGQLESLIGTGDYVRLSNYRATHPGRRISSAVGRLDVREAGTGRLQTCTATLVAEDLILTNHHCLVGGEIQATQASLLMDYYDERDIARTRRFDVVLRPVEADEILDYALHRVLGTPGRRYGVLRARSAAVTGGEQATLFHHPLGQPKVVSALNCALERPPLREGKLLHTCDTLGGSSGALVLDVTGTRVYGLHRAGTDRVNLAVPMVRLVQHSPMLAQLFPDQGQQAPVSSDGPPPQPRFTPPPIPRRTPAPQPTPQPVQQPTPIARNTPRRSQPLPTPPPMRPTAPAPTPRRQASLPLSAARVQPSVAVIAWGNDTGRYARNGRCDDPRFTGPGVQPPLFVDDRGRDATDCRTLFQQGEVFWRRTDLDRGDNMGSHRGIAFGTNAGQYPYDGECDDPRFTGDGMASDLSEANTFRDALDCLELFLDGRIRAR